MVRGGRDGHDPWPLDAAVIPTEGTTFNVTTTSGVVTSNERNIIVDGIEVPAAGSVVITIVGEIA